MKATVSIAGSFDNLKWYLKRSANLVTLDDIGREGVAALANATPRIDSGETARGWNYKIINERGREEVVFYNQAHPELYVNMARLIENGYSTKNGGYVPPIPYIKQALDPIYRKLLDRVDTEIRK